MNAAISRRDLLATAGTTATAAFVLPAFAESPLRRAVPNREAAKLNVLMESFFQENLQESPERATLLGLDKGTNAGLKARLSDETLGGVAAAKALNASQVARLQTVDARRLGETDRVNYDTLIYVGESRARLATFPYGGFGYGASPYVVSQLTGVYQTVPDFLDTKHRIETRDDADAYLARLVAFTRELDGQTERMKHDTELGVIPPDFLLDKTLEQLSAIHTAPDKSLLVTSLARRARDKGLPDSYAADAAKIYTQQIVPALDRQTAEARAMRAVATHDAGLWKIRDGEAFYGAALSAATTTSMTPDEVHRLGREQGAEITARLDMLLRAQGLTQGTVGQRIAALYRDTKQLYANTDDGKAQCIAYCNQRLAEIKPRLSAVFNKLPAYSFEVRRVPPVTEPGAASAFSQPPTLDGSRPGIIYFNLHDTAEWPKLALSTTVFHEGLPGHQLEGGLALASPDLPLIRKTIGFSGYAEGWALYAEQLADEIGMYDNDPYGRIGYLKFQLFRANRCVVDTGIHHLRWTREQAIQYFVDGDGSAPGFAAREVERYCATPGQACSYKIGHTIWTKARDRAKAALVAKYNIKEFHDAGLNCGRVPLDILNVVIDRYIATAKAA